MGKHTLRKEKWTLSFDPLLKKAVIQEAQKRGTYPVRILEDMVKARMNPYGLTDIHDSVAYIRSLRRHSRAQSDEEFLKEIRKWQSSRSS